MLSNIVYDRKQYENKKNLVNSIKLAIYENNQYQRGRIIRLYIIQSDEDYALY